ncbi:hypothetical protein ACHAXR_010928, partial [Thalassiosira sp. AJA248-18]
IYCTMSTSSTSWSWRHRFYAFLLRRALGPFLTPQSAADLYRSIQEIDWSEGKFALVDVGLDPTYLTSAIQGKTNDEECNSDPSGENGAVNNIAVYEARIRRFAIHLSICDVDSQSKNGEGTSTARKATSAFLQSMFGTNDTVDDGERATGIALVAHVELEGLDIVLGPGRTSVSNPEMEWSSQSHRLNQPLTPDPGQEQDASAPGFFSSMVDSAMKSLRLSIDVSDVNIRTYSQYCNTTSLNNSVAIRNSTGETAHGCWIALHLDSARYYDLIEPQNGETHTPDTSSDNRRLDRGTREKMVISKAFDWEGIVVDSGESTIGGAARNSCRQESSLPILHSPGGGRLRFRVFEKWSKNTVGEKSSFLSARQDIEISLGQRIAVEIDLCAITRVSDIANAMTHYEDDGDFVDAYEDDNCRTWDDASDLIQQDDSLENVSQNQTLADEFSREAYDEIMKKYTEARHLARTQELRGGLLIPSFDKRDDSNETMGEVSFDAFFDANDHSVSYYCSMVDENIQRGDHQTRGENSNRTVEQTKIEIGLEEFTVKVHFGSPKVEETSRNFLRNKIPTASMAQESEYILLSMGDLRLIVFGSAEESKVNCSVSHFDIESQVTDRHNSIVNEPLLRFVDDSDGFGDDFLVSSSPCISMMAEFSKSDDEAQACRVDVVLQPLEIVYQERALLRLSDVIAKLPQQSESPTSEEGQGSKSMNIHLSVSSSSILLMIPCQLDSKQMPRDAKPNPIFRRHGYIDQGSGASKFSGLGLELGDVTIDLSRKESHVDTVQTSSEESKAVMTCSHMILFIKGTELERGRRSRKFASYISRRADLIAFTGDEDSQSDVTFSFSAITPKNAHPQKPMKRKSAFPIVLPLSSTKTRQETDESDDEIDHLYDSTFKSKSGSSRIQSSDPQFILSSEANEATRELVVNIPNIFFDITITERQQLSDLLSSLQSGDEDSECSNSKDQVGPSPDSAQIHGQNFLGLAVNLGQMSVVFHGSQPNDSNSYSIVIDKMQVHTLIGSSGVRNVRVLSHDVTLYELSNFCPALGNQYPTSCAERCNQIQKRLTKSQSTLARAIFFRQKLCQPLSPETPAFLMDILLRGDDVCGEMSLHLNIYDMTYRYIVNSEWIQNLTALVKGETNAKESDMQHSAQVEESVQRKEIGVETSSSLINLFVNLADCNLDYTPPQTFRNPSRLIFRMGEIRFTSNIVTPSATVQAFKVSLCDLRLHICNYRHFHNEENSLLSCAHRHLNKEDLFVPDRAKCLSGNVVGLDDALCRMDFVNVIVLDTLDAVIFKSNYASSGNRQNDPATTVALTLGKVSIYACHDSFSCVTKTYDEWFIKTTALSEEELDKLRASSEAQSELGLDKQKISSAESECLLPIEHQPTSASCSKSKVNTASKATHVPTKQISPAPSQQQQYRDDTVSLDLTKSLLFQNYYTFDAKTNVQAPDQRQQTEEFLVRRNGDDINLQSSSSDDEWAAVEHDYLQYSNLPREKDQAAEWVLCDTSAEQRSLEPTTRKAALPSNQPQTVKVFPQHIPVKPILDPFAGGTVDTAKLAGTDVAPNIGTRVIVKDGSITFRFFGGLDWVNDAPQFHQRETKTDRKKELLSSLIDGEEMSTALDVAPLPEDRNKHLRQDLARQKLRRNPRRYFQVSFRGLKMKQDSFSESHEHQLASCLDLSVSDFFIAETISNGDAVKMMGEWINEAEHPRDNSDGIISLKMITKRPMLRVSSDGKLMSDESRATLELLPLRCYFNQNALRFIRNFFAGRPMEAEEEDTQDDTGEDDDDSDDEIINIFFESFKVRPCKLKVDYQPENMDVDSFRDGNYIEILNLCPLEEMILALQPVEMSDLTGWGSIFSELAGRWIEDICATQAHKFLTRASPFHPFSNLGDPLADLAMVLVVPEGNVTDYFKGVVGGTTNFAAKVALEALSTSAKLTRFAANQLPSAGALPRRPRSVPRHAGDAAGHAYESVARGLREANYKIVTVPLREYQQKGAGGAARSALKGIPIGIIAPIAGASEALSYTLLGLRNQLRPDIRKEEEAKEKYLD